MCTLTIVRAGGTLRVACNRDESRMRPPAHPPFISVSRGRQWLAPQDPLRGGTWIAANGAGLVFAILNAHHAAAARSPHDVSTPDEQPSRGTIVPALIDCGSMSEVAWRLEEIDGEAFPPCRLLVCDGREIVEVALGVDRRTVRAQRLDRPLLFTSSSLGDALVEGPRRALFEQMLSGATDRFARQDAFHAHRWRDRPAVSVHMSRPDACTVSTTVVEATTREVRMYYQPAHGAAGIPAGLIIDREQVGDDAAHWTCREHAAV
jgi:hypothetical protein